MTPDLQKECERLADAYKDAVSALRSTTDPVQMYISFKNGFIAAVPLAQAAERERLAKLAPEFDEIAVEKYWDLVRNFEEISNEDFITPGYNAYDNGILILVRWQHSQLSAVIGALREDSSKKDELIRELISAIDYIKDNLGYRKCSNCGSCAACGGGTDYLREEAEEALKKAREAGF